MSNKKIETSIKKKESAVEDVFGIEIRDAPPAHLMIEIQPLSKILKRGIEKHESMEFVAGDYKWRLIIYPIHDGGDCKNEADCVSVFLSISDTNALPVGWSVTADCSILLHNQISGNYFCFRGKTRRFDAKNLQWGLSISKRMLREPYIVDDKCVFGAEILFPIKTCTIEYLSLHEWKIPNFSELQSVWNSEEFTVGGFKWKMKLFPKGNKDAKGESISIYLECVDCKSFAPHEKVKVDFCIRLRNNLSNAHHSKHASHWFTKSEDDWGYEHFIAIGDLGKGFLVNHCCFLETEISVQDVVFTPK